jgi:hypothetical protein
MMKLVKAILLSFLILVSFLRFTVVAQTTNTGVAGEVVAAESFDNGIIAFYTYEGEVGVDLNGDGDMEDDVIRYYNVSSGITTNTTAVGYEPAIGGNIIAFLTDEFSVDEDLNNDTDKDDIVIRYYDITSGVTNSIGEIGYDVAVDNDIITFTVSEGGFGEDLNEDGDSIDRFVWYYNVSTGLTFNATIILGAYASKDGNIIAFETWEEWDSIDLNGDGDAVDSVIRYYNMSTATITNTTAVGHEVSIDGNIIAFYTSEDDISEDLNYDGDMSDRIIRYYNISSGTITNTAVYGTFPCVKGNVIAFETWEPDFGEDLNGDGNVDDNVIRYYDISTGATFTTAAVGYYASVDVNMIAFYTYESGVDEDLNGDGDKTDKVIRYYHIPFQGDLILDDNDVYIIEGRFDINGSIIVKENATLILRNAVINFTQTSDWQHGMSLTNPLNGNPRLEATNTTITSTHKYSINLAMDTYVNVSDSKFVGSLPLAYCWLWVSGTAYFHNLTVHGMSTTSSSDIFLSKSYVGTLNVYSGNVFVYYSSINDTYTYETGIISMDKCTIVALQTFDQSQQYVSNSTITRISAHNETSVWLVNSTFTEHYLYNQSRVFVFWYLDTHVIDKLSQDVPSANVTATYPNATVAESMLTDLNGWARLTLMEKMLNATGEYPIGNYTLTATYEIYSNQTEVNMTGNQVVTLRLEDFVVPEFSSILILPMLMTAVLLAFVIRRRKPTHASKP